MSTRATIPGAFPHDTRVHPNIPDVFHSWATDSFHLLVDLEDWIRNTFGRDGTSNVFCPLRPLLIFIMTTAKLSTKFLDENDGENLAMLQTMPIFDTRAIEAKGLHLGIVYLITYTTFLPTHSVYIGERRKEVADENIIAAGFSTLILVHQ